MRSSLTFVIVLMFAMVHFGANAQEHTKAQNTPLHGIASAGQVAEAAVALATGGMNCCADNQAHIPHGASHCSIDCVYALSNADLRFSDFVAGYVATRTPSDVPGPHPGFLRPPIRV